MQVALCQAGEHGFDRLARLDAAFPSLYKRFAVFRLLSSAAARLGGACRCSRLSWQAFLHARWFSFNACRSELPCTQLCSACSCFLIPKSVHAPWTFNLAFDLQSWCCFN